MASISIWVRPETDIQTWNHHINGRYAPSLQVDGAMVMFGQTADDASILASCNALIAAITPIRDSAQARLAQGWIDEIADNPPFEPAPVAAISESEARALAGDR